MLKKSIAALLLMAVSSLAQVSNAEFKIVEKELVQSVIRGTKVAKVERGDIEGMYEAYLNNGKILYVYPMSKKIFFGDVFTATGTNLTEKKRRAWSEELQKKYISESNVKLSDIQSFSLPIDYNRGSKKYKIAMITDPQCYYCRKAEKFLESSNASMEYIFHIAVKQHQYAPSMINNILLSNNPKKMMEKASSESISKILMNRKISYKDGLNELIKEGVATNNKLPQTLEKQKKEMDDYVVKSGGRGTPLFMIFDKGNGKMIDFIKGADIEKLRNYTI